MERPADLCDQADVQITQSLGRELARIRLEAANINTGNDSGICWNCDEPAQHRWCSPACRDDWQREYG